MTMHDPLADWRGNPFFVLEIATDATPTEVERAGQRLLGLLAVGSASAQIYQTPLGPATRDHRLADQPVDGGGHGRGRNAQISSDIAQSTSGMFADEQQRLRVERI